MKNLLLILTSISITFFAEFAFSKDKASQDHNEPHGKATQDHKEEKDEHDHGSSESHETHHDELEEENSNVGPEKGILEASEEKGFKLSPEALKNFEVKTLALTSQGPWEVPIKAKMLSQVEVNLYRVREGFIKRIDFEILSSNASLMKIKSKDLKEGDSIVINGIGFVRIAELTAFGGAPEGHSH